MQVSDEDLEDDPAYQAWLRKKLAERSDAGSVADLSLPASVPGAPDDAQASAASAALHSLSLTAADGPQPQQDGDPWYAMGAEFLRLPARASRDGDHPGEVVGTAIHVEVTQTLTPTLTLTLTPTLTLTLTLTLNLTSCSATPPRRPTWQWPSSRPPARSSTAAASAAPAPSRHTRRCCGG